MNIKKLIPGNLYKINRNNKGPYYFQDFEMFSDVDFENPISDVVCGETFLLLTKSFVYHGTCIKILYKNLVGYINIGTSNGSHFYANLENLTT